MKIAYTAPRNRRSLILVLAICGTLAAALIVLLLGIASAGRAEAKVPERCHGKEQTIVKTGHIASNRPDWAYVPFDVPEGVRELSVVRLRLPCVGYTNS